jgi:hypothetical protein
MKGILIMEQKISFDLKLVILQACYGGRNHNASPEEILLNQEDSKFDNSTYNIPKKSEAINFQHKRF